MSRLRREREYQTNRMEVHITQLTETNEYDDYVNGYREPKDRETEGGVDPVAKGLGGVAV